MPFDGASIPPAAALLMRARTLIETPDRWSQGSERWWGYHGGPMCLRGATGRACNDIAVNVSVLADAESVLRSKAGMELWEYNDTHTHSEVLALIDAGIAELLTQPALEVTS